MGSLKLGDLAILRTNHKDDQEPFWQDETDWLCTVEFLPTDDPEARTFASDIIGYLFGYAHLTNTRSLALVGDPDANPYELLFSFASSLAWRFHRTGERAFNMPATGGPTNKGTYPLRFGTGEYWPEGP